MSVRASASFPSSCSGAMYWNVPSRLPASVSGLACVGNVERPPAAIPAGSAIRARPKSSSLAPVFVSMTLPGLRSRWTMPARWALSSASAIWAPIRSACSCGSGALLQPVGERLAFEVLHHQVVDPVLLADVVERADVGMVEGGDGARLALEPRAAVGVLARCAGSTLMATVRSSRVSRAR